MRQYPLDRTIKQIDVYLIKSEISDEFYVSKIQHGNGRQAYKNHARSLYKYTSPLFERSKAQNKYPTMYILETLDTTDEMAFRHCVAWARYFMEHGLESICKKSINAYAYDLQGETITFYEEIKALPMEDVLSADNLIVGDYKPRRRAEKTSKDIITIHLSKKDYGRVKKKADSIGMTLSRYCKNMALDGRIVTLDPPPIWEYEQGLLEAINILKLILMAIYQNGNYYPADLENIQKMIDSLTSSREKVMEAFLRYAEEVQKVLPE